MAVISWNQVLLYLKGWKADELTYVATLKLPANWKYGTPLPIASTTSDNGEAQITFKPAPLNTLVDSPVITGEFLKVVKLADDPLTEMDIAADSAAASSLRRKFGTTTKISWNRQTSFLARITIAITTSSTA